MQAQLVAKDPAAPAILCSYVRFDPRSHCCLAGRLDDDDGEACQVPGPTGRAVLPHRAIPSSMRTAQISRNVAASVSMFL